MLYTKFISIKRKVQTYRYVEVGVGFSNIPESGHLSELTLNYIDDAINQLNFILAQSDDVVIWGVEEFHVESGPQVSICMDFDEEIIAEVSTISLKKLMLELKTFKEYCEQLDNYKTIITQAFSAVKYNPDQYKRWPQSDIHFVISINDIFVGLVLEPTDFNLTETAFLS